MNPQEQLCPKCGASGRDNQIAIHSRKAQRYRCKACGRTFSQTRQTAFYQLKKPELFAIVISLLAYGCPPKAVEMTFRLSQHTVRAWIVRSGQHCAAVHEATVGKQQWDLQHIQADEMKIKSQIGEMWMALVLMVRTRLWLGGSVDVKRSRAMLLDCFRQAARCAICRPLLIAVDGMNMYLKVVKQTFGARHPVGKGGRLKWVSWDNITITQVVKKRGGKRGSIARVIAPGTKEVADQLRRRSGGGTMINTALIERLNATFRQRIAALARQSRAQVRCLQTLRCQMFLMGCVYNFCSPHRSLAVAVWLSPLRRHWVRRTPAMVAGLTDHRWTVYELLNYKIQERNT